MKKIILILALCLSSLTFYGQDFYTFTESPQCDSLTGFFYLYRGYTINNKFYKKDHRANSGYGFFYNKGNVFNGDTLFMPVDTVTRDFITILDRQNIRYTKYKDRQLFLDSLIKKYYKTKSVKFKKEKNHGDNDDNVVNYIFIKLKMKIVYNKSYLKQRNLPGRYCFNKDEELMLCKDEDFYYRPILKISILK